MVGQLRMVVLVEGHGAAEVNDGVFVIKADDYDDAFRAALKLGASQEQEYLNGAGARVRWRFAEALQTHAVAGESVENQEVMTEFTSGPPPRLPLDATFSPCESRPRGPDASVITSRGVSRGPGSVVGASAGATA
jgi:hypothetical protein